MYIRTCLALTLGGLLTSIVVVSGAGSIATRDLANRIETVDQAYSLSRHLGKIERARLHYQSSGTDEDLSVTRRLVDQSWDEIVILEGMSQETGLLAVPIIRLEESFKRYRQLLNAYADSRRHQSSVAEEMQAELDELSRMAVALKQQKRGDYNRTLAVSTSVRNAEEELKTALRLSALANEIIVVQMTIARSVALFKGGDKMAAAEIPLHIGRFAEIADRIRRIEQVAAEDQQDKGLSDLPDRIAKNSNRFQIEFDEFRLAAREQSARADDMAIIAAEVTDLLQNINAFQTREAVKSSDLTLILSALGLCTAILFGAISLVIVRKRIIAPLTALTRAMQRMSGGDLSVAAPDHHHVDEIGDMAAALEIFRKNSLEARRLATENVVVAQALAKEQAEAAYLEQSLQKEKELNTQQRSFVSLVSHEFRTPLSIIDGQAQRLIRSGSRFSEDKRIVALEKMRNAVRRLTELMESVLSSASMEAGAITFDPKSMDLKSLVEGACQSQQELASTHRIEVDIDDLPDNYVGDPKLMHQVLANLLSNAVKYSPEAYLVRVKGCMKDENIEIAVYDHGVGIPEEDLPKMFERFFRAKTSAGIQGTGLGLNVVKTIVEMHGGSLALSSVVGEGSAFTITLPCRQEVQAPIAAVA